MKLIEKENCFFIENLFEENISAGFSKPALSGNILEDIPKIFKSSSGGLKIAFLNQIHSPIIHSIVKEGSLEGDGLVTRKTNIICVVRTADCMPVFLSSKKLGIIGIIHMGWRGAKKGILGNIKYDLQSFKVLAGLGLRKCCYKAGKDFLEYPEFSAFLRKRDNDLYFNPIGFIKESLAASGLQRENFFDLNLCSHCGEGNFFSFRKDKTDNRTLSFIAKR